MRRPSQQVMAARQPLRGLRGGRDRHPEVRRLHSPPLPNHRPKMFRRLRLHVVAGALKGPRSTRLTWGPVKAGILTPKRLRHPLLLPIGAGHWILQGPGVNQILSLRGIHPRTDKLGDLLLTVFMLLGME